MVEVWPWCNVISAAFAIACVVVQRASCNAIGVVQNSAAVVVVVMSFEFTCSRKCSCSCSCSCSAQWRN